MEVLKRAEKDGKVVEVHYDEDPMSPREWDNATTLICFHGSYELGDKHDYRTEDHEGWQELGDAIRRDLNPVRMVPLFLIDHSGIALRLSESGENPFFEDPGSWDSGMVGWAIVTKDDQEKCGTPDDRLDECIRGEVDTYNDYLSGAVYGYVIYEVSTCDKGHEHRDVIDSCWGFYGSAQECLEEGLAAV